MGAQGATAVLAGKLAASGSLCEKLPRVQLHLRVEG
jgi:hypothetical protein